VQLPLTSKKRCLCLEGAARRLSRKGAEYEIRVDWSIAIAPP